MFRTPFVFHARIRDDRPIQVVNEMRATHNGSGSIPPNHGPDSDGNIWPRYRGRREIEGWEVDCHGEMQSYRPTQFSSFTTWMGLSSRIRYRATDEIFFLKVRLLLEFKMLPKGSDCIYFRMRILSPNAVLLIYDLDGSVIPNTCMEDERCTKHSSDDLDIEARYCHPNRGHDSVELNHSRCVLPASIQLYDLDGSVIPNTCMEDERCTKHSSSCYPYASASFSRI
jgi:hypothetical protein